MISRSKQSQPLFIYLSMVFLLAFILTGCMPDDGSPDNSDPTPTSVPTQAPTNNQPPMARITAPQNSRSGQTVTLDGSSSSDPDGDTLSYHWVQTAGPNFALSNSSSTTLTFNAPTVSQPTQFTFQLTVRDSDLSSSASTSFLISPKEKSPNRQPYAMITAPQNSRSGQTVTLDGSSSSDPDSDTLSYHWVQTAGLNVALSNSSSSTLTFNAPTVSQATQFTFQLTVRDSDLSSTASASFLVAPPEKSPNRQPYAMITAPQNSNSGQTVTLDGSSSSDPDGDTLSYHWVQTAGLNVALSNSSSSTLTFNAPTVSQPTQFTFQLTVRDSDLSSSASASFLISPKEKSPNRQPYAMITAPQNSRSGQIVTLDGSSSSDPDGDTLSYHWVQTEGPNFALSNSSSSTLTFNAPTVSQPTQFTFQLTVDDGYLSSQASVQILVSTDVTHTSIHVSGSEVYEGNGSVFSMRGINIPHAWYPDKTNTTLSDIAKTGANSVRIVLSSGHRWNKTTESTVRSLIEQAKANKLIAVLEVHDTTGYGEQTDATTLSQAVDYWKSIQGALIGQEDYVIINIGNEPLGSYQPDSAWSNGHIDAIKSLRSAGLTHALMVDAPNWGQDWQNIMRDNAASVLAADPQKNVIFSVHMYQVYDQASTISSYMSAFKEKNLALVVGEFAADHQGADVDEASVLNYARQYGYGYFGWSWSGNSAGLESLDIALDFNASTLSSWGETLINGVNGIRETSTTGTIFDGGSIIDPLDTDGDGIGNDVDTDDDGDGVLDVNDAFPLDSTESEDTDADGIGNNADPDDDNDGMSDRWEEMYGLHPDTDDANEDADGDGYTNIQEFNASTDPQDASSKPLVSIDDLSLGEMSSCAIVEGEITCWGLIANYPIPANLTAPEQIGLINSNEFCALQGNKVTCWGNSFNDDLLNTTVNSASSLHVTPMAHSVCVITLAGNITCWGSDDFGIATPPDSLINIKQMDMFQYHACAHDGATVQCWGRNTMNQTDVPADIGVPVQVVVGGLHSCVLQDNQQVRCWGDNSKKQTNVPVDLDNVVSLDSGYYHTCAITDLGEVKCWGDNSMYNQTDVPIGLSGVTELHSGPYNNCAVTANGAVCWGRNDYGQSAIWYDLVDYGVGVGHVCGFNNDKVMCFGNTLNGSEMLNIPAGISKPKAIGVGGYHNCVWVDAGSMYCWGKPGRHLNYPAGLTDVTEIGASYSHTCAIDSGKVVCWGDNFNGVLNVPSDILQPHELSVGDDHNCVLDGETSVRCWGANYRGQSNPAYNLANPVTVATGGVGAYPYILDDGHTCIVDDNGVECRGSSAKGVLKVPAGLSNVIDLYAGWGSTCALEANGTVSCWGDHSSLHDDVLNIGNVTKIKGGSVGVCAENSRKLACSEGLGGALLIKGRKTDGDDTGNNLTHTLTLDVNHKVMRSGSLGERLGWVVEKDGVIVLDRNAADELEYTYYSNYPGSTYRVWLNKFINGKYERVSNVVEYIIENDSGTETGTDSGNITYTLTLDANYKLTRSGSLGERLGWVVEKDGVIVLDRNAADELEYTYYSNYPGSTYRVWLNKFINGKYERVSNVVEYIIENDPGTETGTDSGNITYTLTLDANYKLTRSGSLGERLGWVVEKDGVIVLDRNAADELEYTYTYYSNYPGSTYRVWLNKFINGKYERVSNVVEYVIKNNSDTDHPTGYSACHAPKTALANG